MRKSTVLCFLLAVLSAAFLVGAAFRLDGRKNDVTVEETVLSGDPSAAAGLHLHTRLRLDNEQENVWWEWDHRFSAEQAHSASFRFAAFPPLQTSDPTYTGLTLYAPGPYESADGDWIANAMYEELAARAAVSPEDYAQKASLADYPAESSPLLVSLADYFDTLPLDFHFSFPNATLDFTPNASYGGAGTALYRKLNEAFRIPTTADMTVSIAFNTYEDGRVSHGTASYIGSSADGVFYGDSQRQLGSLIESASCTAANGIYFTLSPRPAGLPALDLSGIALGYGVYYLPMEPSEYQKGYSVPDPDGLRLAVPLDPDAIDTVEEIVYQAEHDRLFLLTCKDGLYTLTAVRESTGEVLSMLELTSPIGWPLERISYEDGFLIASYQDDWFSVIAEGEDGYAPVFSAVNDFVSFDWDDSEMAFDGKRLAVMAPSMADGSPFSFSLSVFSADGLQFCAIYRFDDEFRPDVSSRHRGSTDDVIEWEDAS